MPDLMMKSILAKPGKEPILVDLGYAKNPESVARFDALREAGLSRRRFSFVGYNRVFAEIPPTKFKKISEKFPIIEGSTYYRATHHWLGLAPND